MLNIIVTELQFIFVLHLIFIQFPVPYFLNKEIKTRKFYNMFQFYLIKVKILGTLCQSLCFTFHSKNLINIFKVIMVIKNYRPQKGLIFFFTNSMLLYLYLLEIKDRCFPSTNQALIFEGVIHTSNQQPEWPQVLKPELQDEVCHEN